MNKYRKLLWATLVFILIIPLQNCKSQIKEQNDIYTYKSGDRHGSGKWYKNREIANVMGYQGIAWLERDNRESEEKTSQLIKNMNIIPTDVIADIGAGSGYHVFRMAPLAKSGMIYAVDIQQEMLNEIEKKKDLNNIENVKVFKGTEKSVNLPENSVDKVLMVDVYHEFSFPFEMMQSITKALKFNGKIYLIEYKAEDPSVPIKRLHKMSEAQAVKEMKAAGLRLQQNIDNLPRQHCMVFVKD